MLGSYKTRPRYGRVLWKGYFKNGKNKSKFATTTNCIMFAPCDAGSHLLCLSLLLACVPRFVCMGEGTSFSSSTEEENTTTWARLQIFQPPLSRCCYGTTARIRWKTFSHPPMPQVGLITWRLGHSSEGDVLDNADGELQQTVKQPGDLSLRFAVESHDRTEVLAEVWVLLVVHERAASSASWGILSGSGDMNDPVVLHHALLPAEDSGEGWICQMECVETASLNSQRILAARLMTSRRAAAGLSAPKFVQIGANDGTGDDPVQRHVFEDGWVGVLVEPLPDMFKRLQVASLSALCGPCRAQNLSSILP